MITSFNLFEFKNFVVVFNARTCKRFIFRRRGKHDDNRIASDDDKVAATP